MARLEPVKRLMLAVLDRAVNDFRAYAAVPTARGRRLFNEVDAWFRASTDGPFDFETICHATGLDPDFIRKRLRSSYEVHADASTRRMRGLRATSPGFVSRSGLRGPSAPDLHPSTGCGHGDAEPRRIDLSLFRTSHRRVEAEGGNRGYADH
jgi:hypothetical protein